MTDIALYWNNVALEANRNDHTGGMAARNQRGPTLSSRALAMVHIAMHDAYFGLVPPGSDLNPKSYEPILPANRITLPAGVGIEDIVASVSRAAFVVLSDLYPSQIDRFEVGLRGAMPALGKDAMLADTFGARVGRNVLDDRTMDGSDVSKSAVFSQLNGHHRADPFNDEQGLLGQAYGGTRHFVLADHAPLAEPPGCRDKVLDENDAQYLKHYREAKEKGRRAGSSRTADETAIGLYWAYDGAAQIGTPPRLYNQIVVAILDDRNRTKPATERLIENLRVLALVNIAMAEAGIDAWYHKYCYNLWRPVIGIRERGQGLGPGPNSSRSIDVDADPFWEPVGAPSTNTAKRNFTPHFPAYPSGHASFGGAVFETLRLYFGVPRGQADKVGFSLVSDELNGLSHDSDGTRRTRHLRRYDRLLDAMYENAVSRVYLGVHWRFDGTTANDADGLLTQTDNIGGVPLGRTIAQSVFDVLEKEEGPDLADFSVEMQNHLSFSDPKSPSIPKEDKGFENLTVILKGDILTISDGPNTIYAQKARRKRHATEFKILSSLPAGVVDPKFFPAEGSAVVSKLGARLRLYAAGTDPRPGAWIFEAAQT
ncbi:phosphatase PAP2 family protein [Bradyrhizobium sp. 138]|uniref:vanadium-dependent haloperoxidase n=1 Tax=Bradyrhizobium sp. 138 TaxID=2782615 RepID=UPI001FF7CB05|nr:vanadium-dependent haloperoxidase [Bradyrhizobium sp. 138]MCK1735885.1 phosphatase PAP2 family protein [Bradyrhizobium sp. 138]